MLGAKNLGCTLCLHTVTKPCCPGFAILSWKKANVKNHFRQGQNKIPEVRHMTENAFYLRAVKLTILMMMRFVVEMLRVRLSEKSFGLSL